MPVDVARQASLLAEGVRSRIGDRLDLDLVELDLVDERTARPAVLVVDAAAGAP